MDEYERFSAALDNLKEVYLYDRPYKGLILAGITSFYRVCFGQAWGLMRRLLWSKGYPKEDTEFPRQIVKAACRAGIIEDEKIWLEALEAYQLAVWTGDEEQAVGLAESIKGKFYPLFHELKNEVGENWIN